MADGGHIDGGWLSAISGSIGAGLGALALWLGPRLMGKAAFQEALNHGFSTLMDQMRMERTESQEAIAELRDELETERVGGQIMRQKIVNLEGEVRDLKQANASLRAQLERNALGEIVTPHAPKDRPIPNLIELPATKGDDHG